METKVCNKCGRELPVSEFYLKNGNPREMCKDCMRTYNREYARKRRSKAAAEAMLPADKASDEVVMQFLGKVHPRLLMKALFAKGYRGNLTATQVISIDLAKIGEDE